MSQICVRIIFRVSFLVGLLPLIFIMVLGQLILHLFYVPQSLFITCFLLPYKFLFLWWVYHVCHIICYSFLENSDDPPKPRELYIPPEPVDDEAAMFDGGISCGINFDKYDNIKVEVCVSYITFYVLKGMVMCLLMLQLPAVFSYSPGLHLSEFSSRTQQNC